MDNAIDGLSVRMGNSNWTACVVAMRIRCKVHNKEKGENKMNFEYGWGNGKLKMEEVVLTPEETKLLEDITEIAFREMGERTRAGSGDDQAYVEGLYEEMKKVKNNSILVRIVFLLCRQANPGSEFIREVLATKDEQINKLIHENLIFFDRGTVMGSKTGKTWHEMCGKKEEDKLE